MIPVPDSLIPEFFDAFIIRNFSQAPTPKSSGSVPFGTRYPEKTGMDDAPPVSEVASRHRLPATGLKHGNSSPLDVNTPFSFFSLI